MIGEYFRRRLALSLVKFLKLGGFGVSVWDQRDGVDGSANMAFLENAYTRHVWAYAGIYAIASAAAGLPIKVFRKIDSKTTEEVEDHPLVALLDQPNEFMTGYDLIELAFIFAESTGSSYWLFDNGQPSALGKDQGLKLAQVKEIWPIPPTLIKPIADTKLFVSGYRYEPPGMKKETLSIAEVLHFKYANPLSMWVGLGSLESAKDDIVGDLYADRFNNAFFKNGGLPAAFLKTEQFLTPEQRTELKVQWSQLYQGVGNAHKVAFLEGGTEFAIPNQTRKDMEFVELSREKRTKILGALGVPPVIVGLDTAKYDNAEQQKAIFWELTMLPKLRKFSRQLTKRLHALGEDEDLFVAFDTSAVKALQGDYKIGAETATLWANIGVPPNSLIPIFGPPNMEPFEGGDESRSPAQAQPLPGNEPPIDPEGTPEDAPPPDEEEEDGKEGGKKSAGDPNKAIDDARWKKFIASQEPFTRKLRFELKKLFAAQRKKVLAKIRKHYKGPPVPSAPEKASFDIFVLNVQEESAAWTKKLKPLIRSIFEKMGADTVQEFGAAIDFSIHNPRAVAFIDHHVPKFSFEVNSTSMERIKHLLEEKITGGATQKELLDSIGKEFDFAERYRAARIARTESGIAGNAGINEGFLQAGVKTKRWISSRDEKVRDSHELADAQEVLVNDPFDVGGIMMVHPGDPKAPAGEICNCRCTMRGLTGDSE